jgi:hypothetical protein
VARISTSITYGSFFAIATLGLTAIAAVAIRHARRAADALDHWRATTCQLRWKQSAERRPRISFYQAQKMETLGQRTVAYPTI